MLGDGWFPDMPGGLNRYFWGLLGALAEAGNAPLGLVLGPATEPPAEIRVPANREAWLPLRLVRHAGAVAVAARDADLVDSHFALYALLPLLVGTFAPRCHIVHFHGPWAAESEHSLGQRGARIRAKHLLEQLVYRRAAALITLSHAFADVLTTSYGIPRERIHVIPPGVELDLFVPADRAAARRSLGLPEDAWIAAAVRRLDPRMGLDVLVEAWAEVRARFPERKLLLVIGGDGHEGPRLQSRVEQLGLAEVVRFTGRLSDSELVAVNQAADVFGVPSTALEGFGLVVLEALACGTPVIVTNVGGLPETVRALDPSLVVPPGDAQALAARLAAALDGAAPLPSRDRCRRYAEGFSWAESARRHNEVYERAIVGDGSLVRATGLP